MMQRYQSVLSATLMLLVVLLAGCTNDRVKISKILNNPDRYVNKEVTIAGDVVNTYQVNLIISESGAYQVDDGSGKIWVLTRGSVPGKGTQVGLKGTVSDKITFLDLELGVIIQEKERRTRE